MGQMIWTDARVERLKELWALGQTAQAIGIELKLPYEDGGRCAVRCKAQRLGLKPRKTQAPHAENVTEKLGRFSVDGLVFVPIFRLGDRLDALERETDALLRQAASAPVPRRQAVRRKQGGGRYETTRRAA